MKNIKVKVLIFDVFGTVVDWRSTIKKELNKFLPVDLNQNELNDFALEWRKGYTDFIGKFNDGKVEWKNVDELHLDKLKACAVPNSRHIFLHKYQQGVF